MRKYSYQTSARKEESGLPSGDCKTSHFNRRINCFALDTTCGEMDTKDENRGRYDTYEV
jgi:hypothetical protein